MASKINCITFPRTIPPPQYIAEVVNAFKKHESEINTENLSKGLTSDSVLAILRDDLITLGFQVEKGKKKGEKIERPVFFGEHGEPVVRYQIDCYNSKWKCGMEIEAGRGWMGNAVYRDLILASVMVDVDHLILAVANNYKYKSSGKNVYCSDYENTKNLVDTIFSHTRLKLPYALTVIGY